MGEMNLFSHAGPPMGVELVGLSASPDSLSRTMVPHVKHLLVERGVKVGITDIRDLPPVWVDGRSLDAYPPGYRALHDSIQQADAVILFVPVHGYTMSAPAKAVADIIGGALAHKPVALVSAAGSLRSMLAMRDLMSSMAFEQATLCWPKVTVITRDDLDPQGQPTQETQARLAAMVASFMLFAMRFKGVRFLHTPDGA